MSTPRTSPAKPLRTARKGGLSAPEITRLVLTARDAFHYQSALGNIAPGETFQAWRHAQVLAAFGRPGTSALDRSQWRAAAAHFLTLAGHEDEAFDMLQKTGQKSYRHAPDSDTWEASEAIVARIREAIAAHLLATIPPDQTHLHTGWFLTAARQRTGKPSLTMDTLAERLAPETLTGLLAHLHTHIARREGRAVSHKSPRSYPPKPDPGDMDDPF